MPGGYKRGTERVSTARILLSYSRAMVSPPPRPLVRSARRFRRRAPRAAQGGRARRQAPHVRSRRRSLRARTASSVDDASGRPDGGSKNDLPTFFEPKPSFLGQKAFWANFAAQSSGRHPWGGKFVRLLAGGGVEGSIQLHTICHCVRKVLMGRFRASESVTNIYSMMDC